AMLNEGRDPVDERWSVISRDQLRFGGQRSQQIPKATQGDECQRSLVEGGDVDTRHFRPTVFYTMLLQPVHAPRRCLGEVLLVKELGVGGQPQETKADKTRIRSEERRVGKERR